MGIQIDSDFIRLWDERNPAGFRIEAMGGPEDKVRIDQHGGPIEISRKELDQLQYALLNFTNTGCFNQEG